MKKILLILAACGFALGAKPQAAEPAKADLQDLVFRSEQGLYKLRLHIQVNGKAASTSWNGFLDKAFAYFDRNGDKTLSPEEVGKMLQPMSFLQGINFIFNGQTQPPKFADLDTNKDGKIDREEFGTYFRRGGLGVVQVTVQPPNRTAEQLTEAFYKYVNARHDGRLTRDDLAHSWERLYQLDQDEDEIITTMELLQQQFNPYGVQAVEVFDSAYPGMTRPAAPPAGAFVGLTAGEPASVAAAKVLQALQSSKQPYLALAEPRYSVRCPNFVRSALRDLDKAALEAWLGGAPDLELTVSLGTIAEGVGRLFGKSSASGVMVRRTGRDTDLEKATALGADGLLRLSTPGDVVEFTRSTNTFGDPSSYYIQQFKTEAGDKKYMDKAGLRQSPQLQFLATIFDIADRDGDGKLFVNELQAFIELLQAGNVCQINVQVVDQGRGLFGLIDTNHDQRLSRRELIDAAKNFAKFDRNGDGAIERGELPRQLRMTVGQGMNLNQNYVNGFAIDGGMMGPGGQGAPARGPAWFRKMDRNKDGDVSLREFLGTPEEFKHIDTDGDGLISPQEAETFEKARKK